MCACESCLKVNVSKGTIVLLQLEEAFGLQKNREDIMGTNPKSHGDLHIILHSGMMILVAFWFIDISQSLLRVLNSASILTAFSFSSFIFKSFNAIKKRSVGEFCLNSLSKCSSGHTPLETLVEGICLFFKAWESTLTVWWKFSSPTNTYIKKSKEKYQSSFVKNMSLNWPGLTGLLMQGTWGSECFCVCPPLAAKVKGALL